MENTRENSRAACLASPGGEGHTRDCWGTRLFFPLPALPRRVAGSGTCVSAQHQGHPFSAVTAGPTEECQTGEQKERQGDNAPGRDARRTRS